MPKGRGPRARAGVLAGATGQLAGAITASTRFAYWRQAWIAWLKSCLREEAEQRRLFLWLPVLFGTGVLLYFAAGREPVLWAPALALVVLIPSALVCERRDHPRAAFCFVALSFLFAGFFASCLKTAMVAAPVVGRFTIAKTIAYVETIDHRIKGARLLLRPISIAGKPAGALPRRVRVTMRWQPQFTAGARISATLRLLPPPVQSEPGGYDFSREAWFMGVGAVGNLVSKPVLVPANVDASAAPDAVAGVARFNAWIDRGRNWLTERISTVIDEYSGAGKGIGAVAAALVTGKRGMIPEETNEALRAAGIYHIVSISGLHMVLAAGLFLWLLRGFLALFPALVLSRPIKVWAALFAMVGASVYCVFSGAEVATQRALVMTLVMLGAIVAGRAAISMRNLAIAALIVLVLDPNALLGPSFQMSFAAVAAMIAAFERRAGAAGTGDPWGMRPAPDDPAQDLRADPFGRIMLVLFAMLITTLVASLATDPYALYHFHRITPYGLLGNMLVLPLVEFIVMPAAVLGVLAAPFGLDGPVWWLMGQGIEFMMTMAHWVAGLKGSVILLPAFGAGALLLMTMALLWLALWQTPIRWAGLIFAAAGIMLAASVKPPDLLISGQGRIAAYRNSAGVLEVLNARANKFGVAQWLASGADPRKPDSPSLAGKGRCDRTGCIGRMRDGRVLALVLSRAALAEDCGRADIVVTPLQAADLCKGPEKLFDRTWMRTHGAARIYLKRNGAFRFETARRPATDRPWSRNPVSQARISSARAPQSTKTNGNSKNGWVKAK